jgi:hypothetical protein
LKNCIVMPTRDRLNRLEVCLPHWLEQDMPIHLVVEPGQVMLHVEFLRERGWAGPVTVVSQRRSNAGIGFARRMAVRYANEKGYTDIIMADDDVYPVKDASVRPLLDFVAKKKAMGVAGWMSSYGLWFPNGNETARQPGLVVPVTGIGDRITAFNVGLLMKSGSFNPHLDVLHENGEIIRQSVKIGYLWFVHTSVHIKMLGKRNDPGGIVALAGGLEQRLAREQHCHEIVYKTWGPEYISHPTKRYSCRWRKLITRYVSARAAKAVYDKEVYEATKVPAYTKRPT